MSDLSSVDSSTIPWPGHLTSPKSGAVISILLVATTFLLHRYRIRTRSSSLKAVTAANTAFSPSYLPVAVFVGGTAGIGRGIVEAFARHTKGNAHIIIIGRNREAAESIFAGIPKPNPVTTGAGVIHEFMECDVTLMRNVQRMTRVLSDRFPRINFLVMSSGVLTRLGREDTEEGLDRKLAVAYYARCKFTNDLLPSLRRASEMGERATVYSVLAAGKGHQIQWGNLGLKKRYRPFELRGQAASYTDVMFQEFATRNPSVSFIHAWPGVVRTTLGHKADSFLLRMLVKSLYIAYPFALSYAESGEYMLFAALTMGRKPGVWEADEDGKELSKKAYVATQAERQILWEHTVEATTVHN